MTEEHPLDTQTAAPPAPPYTPEEEVATYIVQVMCRTAGLADQAKGPR